MTGPLLRRASLRYLARHPLRFGLAALGIALGVSLAVAIDVATVSVRRAFSLSTGAVAGDATHEIAAAGRPVSDQLYRRLRLDPALRAALGLVPVVSGTVALADRPGEALAVIGVDPFAVEAASRPAAAAPLGAWLTTPGAAVLPARTAQRLGLGVGDRVVLRAGAERRSLTVVAIAGDQQAGALASAALVDVATAQETLGLVGALSRIEVRVRPGADEAGALAALAAALPAGVELRPAGARRGALLQMTRAFDLNLRALSLLGLFVGAFLIYNTITVSVAQRQPVLATLRTLGVTRREIAGLVLVEAALLGALGAAAGVGLGVGLGRGLVGLVARGVSDLYFFVSVTDVELPLAPLARGGLVGLVVAVLAAFPAARAATRAEPRAALARSSVEERARARVPLLAGLGAACGLAALAVIALSTHSLVAAFVALMLVLVGGAVLAPAALLGLSRAAAPLLGAGAGLPGRLAARNAGRALSRTGVAVAALLLAISVSVGVSLMVASFRSAVVAWLGETLRADVYVSAPSLVAARAEADLPPDLPARLQALPGLAELATNRTVSVSTPDGPALLIALALGPRARAANRLEAAAPGVTAGAALWARLDAEDAVIVSEPFAWKRGVRPGGVIALATAAGPRRFAVLGVFRDYGSDAGTVMISRARYERHFPDRGFTAVALFAAPGTEADALVAAARAVVRPGEELAVRSNRALREASLEVFDRTFEITSVLRLLALVVAALGVTGALMALELERTRELGTLRALGFTTGQVGRLLALETGLLGLVAGLLAAPFGTALAALLVFVINRRSFGWTMPLQASPAALLVAPLLGLAAGLVGGLYPAWRLGRTARQRGAARGVMDRRARTRWWSWLLALALAGCGGGRGRDAEGAAPMFSPTGMLSGEDTSGYARAEAPRVFSFPADHGPHPDFRSEWWYFTGQLSARDGGQERRFGYQLTIFRQALAPAMPARASAWATRQVYLGHLAVADIDGGRFLAFERTAREGLGLAGAQAAPLRVWVEDWEIVETGPGRLRLRARAQPDGVAATAPVTLELEVDLAAGRGPILQGDRGLSRKGPQPGNASYYFSCTRLPTRGRVAVGERAFDVAGESWLDREWSTSALGPDLAGWDWLSLSLSDGSDVMVFRLRRRDGGTAPESRATLIAPGGGTRLLPPGEHRFDGAGTWTSPTGARYPASFRLLVPADDLTLEVTPLLPDQELRLGFRYWEGAVHARGRRGPTEVTGRGYLELTGYTR